MEQREVNKKQIEFLQQETEYYEKENIITKDQRKNILNLYKIKQRISFITVLVVIGSVLIGLGVLSFIASNWIYLNKFTKLIVIFGALIGTVAASYKLSENYPKTSRSLLYLGVLIYGAGIFLIGQMFNIGGHFTYAFLLWAIGILPSAVIFKDKIIFAFVNVLFLVYLNSFFDLDKVPLVIFLILPTVYCLNYYFMNSKLVTFFNNLILINTMVFFAIRFGVDMYTVLLLFGLGLVMYFLPIKYHENIFKVEGSMLFGITGIILTIPYVWSEMLATSIDSKHISIVFAVMFTAFLLWQVKRESLISLIFVCLTILKFYFDVSYDFMPKSLFFIVGGILLFGLGFYFEKSRKRLGGMDNEQKTV